MLYNIFSGLILVLNALAMLLCNITLKKSNQAKPESMISELDFIFHDIVDCYCIIAYHINGYNFAILFLGEVDYFVDLVQTVIHMGLVYLMSCIATGLLTLKLLHVYQKSSFLENFTYQTITWVVRVTSLFVSLSAITVSIFIFEMYPYSPLVHHETLIANNSTKNYVKVNMPENQVWTVMCFTNCFMLVEVMRQKLKIDADKTKYIKMTVYFILLMLYTSVATYILHRSAAILTFKFKTFFMTLTSI